MVSSTKKNTISESSRVSFLLISSFCFISHLGLLPNCCLPLSFLFLGCFPHPPSLSPSPTPSCQRSFHPLFAGTLRPLHSLVVIGPGCRHASGQLCPSVGQPAKWRSRAQFYFGSFRPTEPSSSCAEGREGW